MRPVVEKRLETFEKGILFDGFVVKMWRPLDEVQPEIFQLKLDHSIMVSASLPLSYSILTNKVRHLMDREKSSEIYRN